MIKRPSLKDIARMVGVSTALVSYVLNNQKQGRISKEIALKIREAAAVLNYRPNQIAKSLKTNKTFTIGLVVADISNPFSATLARFIEDEADQKGYTVIFGSSDENILKSEKLIDTLLNRQVDGLILSPPADSESQVIQLQKQEIPFVLLDRYFPGVDTNWVALNNYSSSQKAVHHLIQAGCSRIAMLTYDTPLFHLQERKRAYIETLQQNNMWPTVSLLKEVNQANDQMEIETALHDLIFGASRIDGLIFTTNRLAISSLKYIQDLPLKVPQDLALIGFDETEAFDFFYAPLTYIKQPLQEMGKLVNQVLVEQIQKQVTGRQFLLDGELVVRQSTKR